MKIRTLLQLMTMYGTIATSEIALANGIQWHLISAKGQGSLAAACRVENISSTSSGDNASLVLTGFDIDLSKFGKRHGAHASGYCDINMAMVIPQNHYMSSMSSALLGGVVKDKGAMTFIEANWYMTRLPQSWEPALLASGPFGMVMRAFRIFPHRDNVNEPLVTLDAQRNFSKVQQRQMCQWTRTRAVTVGYRTRLSIVATRSRIEQVNIAQVDGIDNNVSLSAVTSNCP
ncbi:MAG: hypothetical protein RIQ81_2635 [Pseudomonadota bacterium]|jgi:hypothetical protein